MPGEVFDGFTALPDGMNAELDSALLGERSFVSGVNVTTRGGFVRTRPGFSETGVTLPAGTVQGVGRWSLNSGDRLVFVMAGVVYTIRVDTMALTNLGLQLDTSAQCFFCQADRYLVIQDGVSTPVVLEEVAGVDTVRAAAHSIPIGTVMVYAHQRLHVVPDVVKLTALPGDAYIESGDILLPNDPTTVLEFTETEYLATGGAHAMPEEMGFIGALATYRNAHTGTGVGEVIGMARNGLAGFDFSLSRDLWDEQPLSRVLFFGAGTRSPWGVVNINDDLVYRSTDGVRILRYALSEIAGSTGNLSDVPASLEVDTFLKDDASYLPYVSAAHADNYFLVTAKGTGAYEFQGIVAWDLSAKYYGSAKDTGSWTGIWTGDHFTHIIRALSAGTPTVFAFADGPVLYELDADATADSADSTDSLIESRLYTRALNWGDLVTRKKLLYAELWVSDLQRDTSISVYYRPKGYPLWSQLGSKSILVPSGSLPQVRRKVRISLDPSALVCDPTTLEKLYSATDFEFAIDWTGYMKLERFRVAAEPLQEAPPRPCDSTSSVVLAASATAGQTLDDFSYSIRSV